MFIGRVNGKLCRLKSFAQISSRLQIMCTKRRVLRLFGGFENWVFGAPSFQPRVNIHPALTTIEFSSAGALNACRSFRALGGGGVNFRRIDIIAEAMDHGRDIGFLRMNVNNVANHSQTHSVNQGLTVIIFQSHRLLSKSIPPRRGRYARL